MARILEIAQFDSTDSWEDRTLKKLNLNFRQIQGAFDFLQSSVPSSSSTSSGGKKLLWWNDETEPPYSDQTSGIDIAIPYEDYDALLIKWRVGDQGNGDNGERDYYMSQLVPYRQNFILTQISTGGAAQAAGDVFRAYSRLGTYDEATSTVTIGRVLLARDDGSNPWHWAADQHAMIIMEVYGVRF